MCRLVAFVTLSTPTQHSVTRLHNYSSHNTPSALIYYVSVRWRQPLWKPELIQCQNSASRIIIDDACLNIRQLPASCSGYFNQLLQKHLSCRLAKRLGLYRCLKRAGARQEQIDVSHGNDGHFALSQPSWAQSGCQARDKALNSE